MIPITKEIEKPLIGPKPKAKSSKKPDGQDQRSRRLAAVSSSRRP